MPVHLPSIRASLTIDAPGRKRQRIGVEIPISVTALDGDVTTIAADQPSLSIRDEQFAGRLIGDALGIDYDRDRAERIAKHRELRAGASPSDFVEGVEHLVYGDRQHGKTWLAMRWLLDAAEDEERVLIVRDTNYAAELRTRYGLPNNDPRIVSWRQAKDLARGRSATRRVRFGIDDAGEILSMLLGITDLRLVTVGTAASGQGDTPVELGRPDLVLACDRCTARIGSSKPGKLVHGRSGAHTAVYDEI